MKRRHRTDVSVKYIQRIGDSSMDSGYKTVDIINSPEVQVMKEDGKTLLILILKIWMNETSIGKNIKVTSIA